MIERPAFTVGIEEEYLIVDRESRDLVREPSVAFLAELGDQIGTQVAPEYLQCQVEVGTRPHRTVGEAIIELRDLRRAVAEVAEGFGYSAIAASTHPFARWREQTHTKKPRYEELSTDLGLNVRRLLICGCHVHVGIEDEDLRIDLMSQAAYFLPHLLALSCSSPFWEGEDTGLASYRLSVFDALPRTGLPDPVVSFSEYRRLVDRLVEAGCIEDGTKIWWDIRPSDKFPTLEQRITDICSRIEDTACIAAVFQSLIAYLYRLRTRNQRWRIYPPTLVRENRWRAQRYGVAGKLVDHGHGTLATMADLVEELIDLLGPDAEALDCHGELIHARRIVREGSSATRQRELYAKSRESGMTSDRAFCGGRGSAHRGIHRLIGEIRIPALVFAQSELRADIDAPAFPARIHGKGDFLPLGEAHAAGCAMDCRIDDQRLAGIGIDRPADIDPVDPHCAIIGAGLTEARRIGHLPDASGNDRPAHDDGAILDQLFGLIVDGRAGAGLGSRGQQNRSNEPGQETASCAPQSKAGFTPCRKVIAWPKPSVSSTNRSRGNFNLRIEPRKGRLPGRVGEHAFGVRQCRGPLALRQAAHEAEARQKALSAQIEHTGRDHIAVVEQAQRRLTGGRPRTADRHDAFRLIGLGEDQNPATGTPIAAIHGECFGLGNGRNCRKGQDQEEFSHHTLGPQLEAGAKLPNPGSPGSETETGHIFVADATSPFPSKLTPMVPSVTSLSAISRARSR